MPRFTTRRAVVTAVIAMALLAAAAVASLLIGPFSIAPHTLIDTLLGSHPGSMEAQVIFTIRLPRLVAACVAGWALAVAGLVFQALLRNPLASEYTLGVSSGAALGAVGAALIHATSPLATTENPSQPSRVYFKHET